MVYTYYQESRKTRASRLTIASVAAAFTAVAMLSVFVKAEAAVPLSYTDVPFTQTELDTNWTPDRTTPSGGYESVSYGGRDDVLELSVDGDNASPTSGFYRTEGIQRQVGDVAAIRADLFVDEAWLDTDVRAGLWGVAHDSSEAVSAYPIAEFTTAGEGDFTGWRVWDGVDGGWTNLPNVAYNTGEWNTLEIAYNAVTNQFEFSINGTAVAANFGDTSTDFGGVILNSFNYAVPGEDYDVRWSNFALGVVPGSPKTKDQCKNDGWKAFSFKNQGQCVSFVNHQ